MLAIGDDIGEHTQGSNVMDVIFVTNDMLTVAV
jgi:hypothetical protein